MVGFGVFSILILVVGCIVFNVLSTLFTLNNAVSIISLLVCCLMGYLAISMTGSLAPFFIILIIFIYLAATKK